MFWRKKGEEFHEQNTAPTVRHAGGSMMLWAWVAASGTGNISLVEGRMDLIKYQHILESNHHTICKKAEDEEGGF